MTDSDDRGRATSSSDTAASIQTHSCDNSRSGRLFIPEALRLHFGDELTDVHVGWKLSGAEGAPIVAVLGGISAGRDVVMDDAGHPGWWSDAVGPGKALDTQRLRILGIDYLGGSGATTGPQAGQMSGKTRFPSISAYDQVAVLRRVVQHLGISQLEAIVGASYGGMVALALAEQQPQLAKRIIVISAAHYAHPMATAWRSMQRAFVRYAAERGDGPGGLKLARALAMATYRSPAEFSQRFRRPPVKTESGFRFAVEDYLLARGSSYAKTYIPEAFVCLSESIDLHEVDPTLIQVPTTLIGIAEDQLVPLADMRALAASLAGPSKLFELSSLYGHDAFLKEGVALRKIFAEVLVETGWPARLGTLSPTEPTGPT